MAAVGAVSFVIPRTVAYVSWLYLSLCDEIKLIIK